MLLAVTRPLAMTGAGEAKVVAAFTAKVLPPPLVPNTTLPSALKALPAATVTAALAVMVAPVAKLVAAYTVKLLLLLVPRIVLPRALKAAFAVTAALAVMGAVEAKVVTALTVRVWLPVVPKIVLPAAVRVLLVLLRVIPAKTHKPRLTR